MRTRSPVSAGRGTWRPAGTRGDLGDTAVTPNTPPSRPVTSPSTGAGRFKQKQLRLETQQGPATATKGLACALRSCDGPKPPPADGDTAANRQRRKVLEA